VAIYQEQDKEQIDDDFSISDELLSALAEINSTVL